MSETFRLFLTAGEPSGDRIGADLIKRLRVHRSVVLSGVGGPELEGEGLKSLFPMNDLAVMGLTDVVMRLPLLLWRVKQTVDAIMREMPDLVVLIDSQLFSETVARKVREKGYPGKILLYVAPMVWAWKPERAPALRTLYDEVLAVLPFEPAVMNRLNGPVTTYVGHPAVEQTEFRPAQPARGPVLLLPGSRAGELRRHLPLMADVAEALKDHPAVTGFVLPTPRSMEQQVVEAVSNWPTPPFVTSSAAEKRMAYRDALVAAAVIGTVTLELALIGVPMVITYVADGAQVSRYKKYKIRFLGLPNILAASPVVPEVIGGKRQPEAFIAELRRLLDDEGAAAAQREAFVRVRARMERGSTETPRSDAVDRLIAHLPQREAIGT